MSPSNLFEAARTKPAKTVGPLNTPVVAGKTSPLYRVHSYHTKVPPEGIRTYIRHFTRPGDVVLDPFCGSGMTGLAAILEGRNAVLSDLSPAAVHIARNYCEPCDPGAFREAAEHLMERVGETERELYGRSCPRCGAESRIEYTIWSDVVACPACAHQILVWDERTGAVGGLRRITCPSCRFTDRKQLFRFLESRPILMNLRCLEGCGRLEMPLDAAERARLQELAVLAIPDPVPNAPLAEDREMWRGGHRDRDIRSAADFYTRRNLRALAALRALIEDESDRRSRDALLFAFTSIVNRASRRYQWNAKRPTNVLTGTLYVASINYEFNVFSLLRRKLRGIANLFNSTVGLDQTVIVRKSSATTLDWIPSATVDYVFTDPPFGSNIFYADSSFLWEAWLDQFTDQSLEAVINKSRKPSDGGKTLDDYYALMKGSFEEIRRVLKPNAWTSIVFHNSDDLVWEALRAAIEDGGLAIENTLIFDKRQPTFKGVKALVEKERVPFFDIVISARAQAGSRPKQTVSPNLGTLREVLTRHLSQNGSDNHRHRSTAFLHSLLVRTCLARGWSLRGLDLERAESLFGEWFAWKDEGWRILDEVPTEGQVVSGA